jgi:alkanesulfonate monooxygenase SsuD/methylene tetrahydromethanopterin reductase-like flavin-dependent oxidoreductase (luciferase family)
VLGVGLGADDYGDLSRFGEAVGVGERAARADEALDVIDALWTGREYSGTGPYYPVELPAGEPEPYRIPVWVAATLPEVRAAHRAARHDGIVLLGGDGAATVENVERAMTALHANGLPESEPFDVVVTGNTSAAWLDAPTVDVVGMADAGMTWWCESLIHFDTLDLTMQVVDAGPSAIRAASPRH